MGEFLRDWMAADATAPAAPNSKKLLHGIKLCGTADATISMELRQKIQRSQRTVGVESMQVDKTNQRKAIMNLFVIKPAQTGFSAMAEMTAAVINNPETTAVLGVRGESGDREAELDLDRLTDALQDSGVVTFHNTDDVANYVNQVADDSEDFDWVEDATPHD